MPTPAIKIEGLKKVYNSGKSSEKIALHGIDLEIPKGSFFGLLGPNGAGKSTLINILAGTVNKTDGKASICGHDITTDTRASKHAIGIVPQELLLDPFFSPYEVLENTAGYYGITKSERRTNEILKAVGLDDKANTNARKLSGGMRRRLLVAKAMVHSPKVLVLDEPTAGVDVDLRTRLWEYVRQLNKQGTTILLTTHYLEEAQELCDHIAVIDKGKIIANDSKAKIMKTIDRKKLVITPEKSVKKLPSELNDLGGRITDDGNIEITYESSKISIDNILRILCDTNIKIRDMSTEEADLEDVFKYLTHTSAD